MGSQTRGNRLGEIIVHSKDVAQVMVERLAPEKILVARVDQPAIDSEILT